MKFVMESTKGKIRKDKDGNLVGIYIEIDNCDFPLPEEVKKKVRFFALPGQHMTEEFLKEHYPISFTEEIEPEDITSVFEDPAIEASERLAEIVKEFPVDGNIKRLAELEHIIELLRGKAVYDRKVK